MGQNAKQVKAESRLVGKDGQPIASITPLFGDVVLEIADNGGNTFAGNRGSGPSCKALNFVVPVNLVNGEVLSVAGTAYARLNLQTNRVRIDPSIPKGLKVSAEYREAWREHVNAAVSAWPFFAKVMAASHKLLTAPPKPKNAKGVPTVLEWAPDDAEPSTTTAPAVPAAPAA